MRRDCRVPRCFKCRAFGHSAEECVRSYARVVGGNDGEPEFDENVMEEDEAEETARPSTKADEKEPGELAKEAGTPPEPQQDQDKEQTNATQECKEMSTTDDGHQKERNAAAENSTLAMDAKETSAKRSRPQMENLTQESSERRLRQLEKDWKKATAKKGKYVSEPRSASLTRSQRL